MENETDLHVKVIEHIRRFYPEALIIAGLGEMQTTSARHIEAHSKGYQKGQPDIIINNYHRFNTGLCIELKTPKWNGVLSEAQKKLLKAYKKYGYHILISNEYDQIIHELGLYMANVRVLCLKCDKKFVSRNTLAIHTKHFH